MLENGRSSNPGSSGDHHHAEDNSTKAASHNNGNGTTAKKLTDNKKDEERRIGVHCVAGLGRAPFFVAIALVNNGCSPSNAIELIRKNRPGALNLTQANYILEFKGMKTQKNKGKGKNQNNASCQCNIF